MEIANEKMLALLDIMRMESYPGEDGEQPQFQDETSAARSMELILKENESEVLDMVSTKWDWTSLSQPKRKKGSVCRKSTF